MRLEARRPALVSKGLGDGLWFSRGQPASILQPAECLGPGNQTKSQVASKTPRRKQREGNLKCLPYLGAWWGPSALGRWDREPLLRKVMGDKNRKRSWRKNWTGEWGVLRGEWKTTEAPEEQWHCLGLGTSAGVCGAAPTLPAHVRPSLLLLKKRREGHPNQSK